MLSWCFVFKESKGIVQRTKIKGIVLLNLSNYDDKSFAGVGIKLYLNNQWVSESKTLCSNLTPHIDKQFSLLEKKWIRVLLENYFGKEGY